MKCDVIAKFLLILVTLKKVLLNINIGINNLGKFKTTIATEEYLHCFSHKRRKAKHSYVVKMMLMECTTVFFF